MTSKLIPTILCGGAGSRLWPVSREGHPKPFIRLADNQSLLQKSFLRGFSIDGVNDIITVTNRELFFQTEDELAELKLKNIRSNYILEPFGRNTAAAIVSAAMYVRKEFGDDAILLVLAADHLISNKEAFRAAVDKAVKLAESGRLVTFGIKPTHPETGYGYIEANGSDVVRFVEKPEIKVAQEYMDSGRFYWNSGMFCFRVDTILQELEAYCPDVVASVKMCLSASKELSGEKQKQLSLDADTFRLVPDISIDYAVMEKSNVVSVVPCDIGWSDIGSWAALSAVGESDENGNRVEAEALLENVKNCYIKSEERFVGAIGLENLVIVDTPDALLVANKDYSQDVKKIYTTLKQNGNELYKWHRTVYRPWGSYTVLENSDRFKIKRLEVKPGGRLSLQMHHHRSEHWIVVSGMAKVVNGEQEMLVNTNESTYIPAGHRHRLENPGVINLVLIEVQSGEYLGEDDIVRFQDVYGRVEQ
ncbi:mannose-1-phosphate guanylyltransferase/mannose-6-phosphate isomerase [Advenella faeciporci]|jgi:mannose-1-phosphate guanylyltransferase|uniref:mannose-1-phosphate guanylyltransferase n=1 Tax=Advenella faeciporci TaxID=797535 RepID=A0A918N1W2_9BURK|nr:mannose-1-phosphate guanylyltransferase/mannose-6-phosphate isomerase [Advenella faeciporci]NLN68530.1 mannose-1-phosphate guanylyltransferase/mannose-6-phosphate isomerase [Alcaligenaceae bacterium]GGW96238.1 mannose-1-phosphate guanylyltransferase/mannose-6-phosphate isomerase [Advenella faeciporci]